MVYAAHQTYNVPHQQQHHLPQHQAHHVQQPAQQLHTSVLQNPLLVNTNINYQQQQYPQQQQHLQQQYRQQQQLQQPVVPPVSYYAQPQTSFPVTAPATAPAQSVASYYRQPQALTAATAGQAHFDQSQLQQQQQQHELQQPHEQPHFSNPQPYAHVTLPNGQHVLDAGHGSGTPPADSSQAGATHQRVGDYAAQSPGATLDTYDYKQSVPGDTRSYQRHVTNCQPNGQCQQLTLNPGQIDGDHQQLLQASRSRTQPAASCKKNAAYVPPGAQVTEQGQLRPRGRRTNQHVQEQLAKYPYN